MHDLHPFKLRPVFKDKIWGGRNLATLLGKDLPDELPIGESWEVADEAVVVAGPFAGQRLGDLAARYGTSLVGSMVDDLEAGFPLLVKFIDAQDRLSVQVHPDDDLAQVAGGVRGKTEAWYVLDAAPGAEIIHGFCGTTPSPEDLARLARDGELGACLQRVPVDAGDVVFIPAGTVHAMGAGVVICEVQQNCDITYRLYDWQRLGEDGRPRELHVEQAATISRLAPREHKIAPVVQTGSFGRRAILVACRYFAVEALSLTAPYPAAVEGRSFVALVSLGGSGEVAYRGDALAVGQGESLIIPASLGQYALRPTGIWQVLLAYVPDLTKDIIAPLLAAGVPARDVLRLGGDMETNDLAGLLEQLLREQGSAL